MTSPATVAFVSFRLGLTDGVSVVAATWMRLFAGLGFGVRTVAGEGPVDVRIPELALDAHGPPSRGAIAGALDGTDLVVVENLLTIPLRLDASLAVASGLRGHPAILHHHDPPWQRPHLAHITALPADDPAWEHVVVNDLTRAQFAARGLAATTIHNGFAVDVAEGDRGGTRRAMGVGDDEILALHPVRAIARKRVDIALDVCRRLGATYWLPGPAEEGFGPRLEALLGASPVRVLRDPPPSMADAYAACDVVVFPSSWEGFGNPPVEAALCRRPAVVSDYPVATELRRFGFCWFRPSTDDARLAGLLRCPDERLGELLDRNRAVAREHFSEQAVAGRLVRLMRGRGWWPPGGVPT